MNDRECLSANGVPFASRRSYRSSRPKRYGGLRTSPSRAAPVGGAHLLLLPAALAPEHHVPGDPRGLAGAVVVGGLLGLLLQIRQHQVREVRPEPEGDLVGIVDLRRGEVRPLRRVLQQAVHRAPRCRGGSPRASRPRTPRSCRRRASAPIFATAASTSSAATAARGTTRSSMPSGKTRRTTPSWPGRHCSSRAVKPVFTSTGSSSFAGRGDRRGLHPGKRARGIGDDGAVLRGERLEVVRWGMAVTPIVDPGGGRCKANGPRAAARTGDDDFRNSARFF